MIKVGQVYINPSSVSMIKPSRNGSQFIDLFLWGMTDPVAAPVGDPGLLDLLLRIGMDHDAIREFGFEPPSPGFTVL